MSKANVKVFVVKCVTAAEIAKFFWIVACHAAFGVAKFGLGYFLDYV